MVVKDEKFHLNNPLVNSNMAIIVTSYHGHSMFLKYTLEKYMESGKYVICSYDSYGKSDIPSDIWKIPHSWVFKHETYGAGKRNGWLWDIVYGSGIVNQFSNFEYVFTTNSDCVWDKPKAIEYLCHIMGDADIMSASSNGTIHTCNVIWKRDCFLDFVSHIRMKLKDNIPASYSPEVLLRDWAKGFTKLGMKINIKTAPIQPIYPDNHTYASAVDHYSSYNQESTWKNILGYRNLGGEHKASCIEHLEPVPKKYIDLRNGGEFLSTHERQTLFFYYISGDRRYLYKYWAEGEDSYWNRRYYPIKYYGEKSLLDDSRRDELGPPSERLGHFDRWKFNSFILKDDEYHQKWKRVIEGE
jgi:hypothetical protein